MVEQITKGIKISVQTFFDGILYDRYQVRYAFGYKVTIENQRCIKQNRNCRRRRGYWQKTSDKTRRKTHLPKWMPSKYSIWGHERILQHD